MRNLCSLLLFVARDRSPRVALALAGKFAANAAARLLRRPEPYRRPFRGASLNLTGLQAELRSMTRPPPPPRREPPALADGPYYELQAIAQVHRGDEAATVREQLHAELREQLQAALAAMGEP